jgi:crossover junction endodeoxyribonuclease RuvC
MFVLGIDPGLTRCGFGVIEGNLEGREVFIAKRAGTIESNPSLAVEKRLGILHEELIQLLDEVRPDAVAVERVFFQRNAKTAIPVAQASGVAVALAATRGIPVRQFTAQEAKLAVTGYGAASKRQMQEMVAKLCSMPAIPEPADAADALGLALTYFMVERIEQRMTKASA